MKSTVLGQESISAALSDQDDKVQWKSNEIPKMCQTTNTNLTIFSNSNLSQITSYLRKSKKQSKSIDIQSDYLARYRKLKELQALTQSGNSKIEQ